jgi:hypothetical protein
MNREIHIKCWTRPNAAQVLGCEQRVLDEIVGTGLVPIIEVGRRSRRKASDSVLGKQFDYIAGAFVPLRSFAGASRQGS